MLRLFAISSRSPVCRPKAFGNTMPLDGAGGSSGEDTVVAGAACFACSVVAGASAFLPQAISRRASKDNTNARAWRDEVEVLDIYLLLYPAWLGGVRWQPPGLHQPGGPLAHFSAQFSSCQRYPCSAGSEPRRGGCRPVPRRWCQEPPACWCPWRREPGCWSVEYHPSAP